MYPLKNGAFNPLSIESVWPCKIVVSKCIRKIFSRVSKANNFITIKFKAMLSVLDFIASVINLF